MRFAIPVVFIMLFVAWFAYQVSEDEACSKTKCAPGQEPRRLMVHRNWSECFCVGKVER